MATTILPLSQIDGKSLKKWAKAKQKEAESYAMIAESLAGIPGVPDLKKIINKEIENAVDDLKIRAKTYVTRAITQIILEILNAATPSEEQVIAINHVIEKVNKIIDDINGVIDFLKTIIGLIFPVIIILTIAYAVAKVISMIPSFGGGFGAVVVATFPGTVATSVQSTCEKLLKDLKPIPMAIISTIMSLFSIFDTIIALFNQLAGILNSNIALKASSQAAAGKSNEDWDATGSGEDSEDILKDPGTNVTDVDASFADLARSTDTDSLLVGNIIERIAIDEQINNINNQIAGLGIQGDSMGDCHLPGPPEEIQKMTPEDCAAAGGIFGYGSPPGNDQPPSPPSSPYTDAGGNVWCWQEPPGEWVCCGGTCYSEILVSCSLPSGEVIEVTASECTAAGGIYPGQNTQNYLLIKSGLQEELDNMGGKLTGDELNGLPEGLLNEIQNVIGLVGDEIITSLINPDPSVTVEEATKNFGSRYGFYQQKTTED